MYGLIGWGLCTEKKQVSRRMRQLGVGVEDVVGSKELGLTEFISGSSACVSR